MAWFTNILLAKETNISIQKPLFIAAITYIHTTCMYIHIYIHTYIHTKIHTNIHTYIHTYIHVYIHTYTYIYTYIYIYVYIYIYNIYFIYRAWFERIREYTLFWLQCQIVYFVDCTSIQPSSSVHVFKVD